MDKEIKKIVSLLKDEIKKDILTRYHKAKYWDSTIISDYIVVSDLSESEKLTIIKEIYNFDESAKVSDLPDWMQDEFDLHEFDEVEKKYICKCCGKPAKAYRMFDVDGMNLEESLVCLNCGDGTLGYKNLKC
jgi:superfamily II helicase